MRRRAMIRFLLAISVLGCGGSSGGLHPVRVRIDGLTSPLAVESASPRISWNLEGGANGARTIAFQIVATDAAGRVAWDSGRVDAADTLDVEWAGRALASRDRVSVRVRAWDQADRPTPWSAPATFEMGLLNALDWSGRWIAGADAQPDPTTPLPTPHLRRDFALAKPVARARAYVAGVGHHELYVNGRRVGDQVLEPGFTRYDRRVLYVAYDVGDLLRPGDNAVGVILGNGFFNPSWRDVWGYHDAPWRATPRLLMQLEVEHPDGSRTVVVSDERWQVASGPILRDALRNGERYDARLELPGWSCPGQPPGAWAPVTVVAGPAGQLRSRLMPPIRVTQTLVARAIAEPRPGVHVFDFGQNLAGWARISVTGEAGREVVLRYGERLGADGTIDNTSSAAGLVAGEFQTDRYVLAGIGAETWEPRFVYHGFRYVEVSGLGYAPDATSVTARVVHTDFPRTGTFACSNEVLNRLFEASVWSYRSNFMSIPTDCPQREKNGWTADAHLAAELGLLVYDAAPGYASWLQDVRDAQRSDGALPGIVPTPGYGYAWGNGPAWDSALFLVPWYVHLYDGDARPLTASGDAFRRYLEHLSTVPYLDASPTGWLGDWVHLDQDTPLGVTHAAYHAGDADIAAVAARLAGDEEAASRYRALAAQVRRAFQDRYLDAASGRIANGTQTAQAAALHHDMVPPEQRARVLERLLSNIEATAGHVNAGVHGAKWIPRVLTAGGHADVAYGMVSRTDPPGWGSWIARGATTLWENWDGSDSLNHVFFADVAAWLVLSLAGLQPDPAEPGWRHVVLQPELVDGLDWASATALTSRGTVSSRWARSVRSGWFSWEIEIPIGSRATLVVPFANPRRVVAPGTVEGGTRGGRPVLEAPSGRYRVLVLP